MDADEHDLEAADEEPDGQQHEPRCASASRIASPADCWNRCPARWPRFSTMPRIRERHHQEAHRRERDERATPSGRAATASAAAALNWPNDPAAAEMPSAMLRFGRIATPDPCTTGNEYARQAEADQHAGRETENDGAIGFAISTRPLIA